MDHRTLCIAMWCLAAQVKTGKSGGTLRMMGGTQRIYILDQYTKGQSAVYSPWLSRLDSAYEFVTEYTADWTPPDDAGIICTHLHYTLPEVTILRRLTAENRIPILILADGMLEYRNTFEHPGLAAGAVFQPVQGHKVAVIGASQARTVQEWGNPNKAEVVGLPKCDPLMQARPRNRTSGAPFRIMVATAFTPAFDETQLGTVMRSLQDLKSWLQHHPAIGPTAVEVQWRITGDLADLLGVPRSEPGRSGDDVVSKFADVDAVISTPSTLVLEAALLGLPVALLDYNQVPHYFNPAWLISAYEHLYQVVPELLTPAAAKMDFQRTSLRDALFHATPATPRMVRLVNGMLEARAKSDECGEPLRMPSRILDDVPRTDFPVFQVQDYFTESHGDPDPAAATELNHYREYLRRLERENGQLMKKISVLETELGLRIEENLERQNEHISRAVSDLTDELAETTRIEKGFRETIERSVSELRHQNERIIKRLRYQGVAGAIRRVGESIKRKAA